MIPWEPVLSPQTIMASQDSPATPELRVIKGTTPSLIMCVSCTPSQSLFWLDSKLPSVPEDRLLDSSICPLTPGSHWPKSLLGYSPFLISWMCIIAMVVEPILLELPEPRRWPTLNMGWVLRLNKKEKGAEMSYECVVYLLCLLVYPQVRVHGCILVLVIKQFW